MTDYYDDDGLNCDGEYDDVDTYYPPDGYRNYDSDSYYEDDASVDSEGDYRRPTTPSTPFCRMKSVAEEEEEIVAPRPKYSVLTRDGWTGWNPEEVPESGDLNEKVVESQPPPKAKFSWNAPKPATVSKDLATIFSEQQAEAQRDQAREEALKNRRSQGPPFHQSHQYQNHQHRDDRAYDRGGQNGQNRRPRPNRPPREQMPQSHGRLLANPNSRVPTVVASRPPSVPSDSRDSRENRDPRRPSDGDGRGMRQDNRDNRQDRRQDRTDRTDPTGRRNDLLCIHPVKHNHSCKLPHSFEDWEPKSCKYAGECSRKNQCSFWHVEMESKEQYLTRALRQDIVFFRKNRNQYLKTYKIQL
jgi:hypothetical protein